MPRKVPAELKIILNDLLEHVFLHDRSVGAASSTAGLVYQPAASFGGRGEDLLLG
jgi:hypothetical protein